MPLPSPSRDVSWLLLALPGVAVGAVVGIALARNESLSKAEIAVGIVAVAGVAGNLALAAWAPVRKWTQANRAGIVLAYVVLALCLVAAEFALRAILWPPAGRIEGSLYRRDEMLGFAHKPNASSHHVLDGVFDVTYHIDSDGNRVIPVAVDISEDAPRILVVGCSQTFGHGVSDADAWPAQLQRMLGSRARVLNAAVSAYGPQQMVRRAMIEIERDKPDIIIVPIAEYHLVRLGDDPVWNAMIAGFGFQLPKATYTNGELSWTMVPPNVTPRDDGNVMTGGPPRPSGSALYKGAKDLALGAFEKIRAPKIAATADAVLADDLQATVRAILELATVQSRILVVILPEPTVSSPEVYEHFKATILELRNAKLGGPGQHGPVPFDAWPIMRAAGASPDIALHPRFEPHFNPATHRALAKALLPLVEQALETVGKKTL